MRFYTLKNRFGLAEYAEYSIFNLCVGDCTYCPLCNLPNSQLEWQSPKKVNLSKPKFGDFVFGASTNLVCSEQFRIAFLNSNLNGILNFEKIEIVKIKYLKNKIIEMPKYYYVPIVRPKIFIDSTKTFKNWEKEPKCICGSGGMLIGINGFDFDQTAWQNEDLFYIIGFSSPIFSQRFVDFVLENKFSNIDFVATEDYKWGDLKPRIKKWVKPIQ